MSDIAQGIVAPGFENVMDSFNEVLEDSPLGGGALAVMVNGELVVDLWGGSARTGNAWMSDTATVMFSATKGMLSILVGQLVEDGLIDLDNPVAEYWPEFAQKGKEAITVRQVMSHQAGLPFVRQDISRDEAINWDFMSEALAAEAPVTPPGDKYGYHALTFGWLVGEIIRRVSGERVGEFFRNKITTPLHADAWIGVPEAELHRVAELNSALGAMPDSGDEIGQNIMRVMTLGGAFPPALALPGEGFNDPQIQKAEVPGAGGVATAKALATIWSATVCETNGVRLIHDDVVRDMTQVQSEGAPFWPIPGPYPRWATGFMLTSDAREFLTQDSFGHDGAGGQVAFADRANKVGFGFVTNDLQNPPADQRANKILRELRTSLGIPQLTSN